MPKARMTRRIQRAYEAVLAGEDAYLFDLHSFAGFGGFHPMSQKGRPLCVAWQASLFAACFHGRADVDVRKLESLVLRFGDPECAYHFALHVPGADVAKLRSVAEGSPRVLARFNRRISLVASVHGKG